MSFSNNFNDPLVISWNSTLVDIIEPITSMHGRAILGQIPDQFRGCVIGNLIEIKTGIPQSGEVKIDYQSGICYFASDVVDGTKFTASYSGRGVIRYPSSRIVRKNDEDVVETLDTLINRVESNFVQFKDVQTDYAIKKAEWDSQVVNKLAEATNKINDTEIARQNALTQANATQQAIANANAELVNLQNAKSSTQIIWKPYVANFAAIATTYPSPQEGWATQTIDTGDRYRYTSGSWVKYEKVVVVQGSNVIQSTNAPTDVNALWVDLSS